MEKNNKHTRRLSVHQGDIVLVRFSSYTGRKESDKRPGLVISNDSILGTEKYIAVIPLYRKPSRSCRLEDIPLRMGECAGVKCDLYAQPLQLVMVSCYQVEEHLGRIIIQGLLKRILDSVVHTMIAE